MLDSSYIVAQVVFLSFTSLQGQVAAIYNTFGICCQSSLQFTRQVPLEGVINYVSIISANSGGTDDRKSEIAAKISPSGCFGSPELE